MSTGFRGGWFPFAGQRQPRKTRKTCRAGRQWSSLCSSTGKTYLLDKVRQAHWQTDPKINHPQHPLRVFGRVFDPARLLEQPRGIVELAVCGVLGLPGLLVEVRDAVVNVLGDLLLVFDFGHDGQQISNGVWGTLGPGTRS